MFFAQRLKSIAGFLLTLSFIFSPLALPPQVDAAVFVPVNDTPNTPVIIANKVTNIKTTVESTLNTIHNWWSKLDSSVFQTLATNVAKGLLKQVTASIVDWINSGFQGGGPSFVTDPGSFFTDWADQEIGSFIESSELGFLCSPFRFEVRLALAKHYSSFRKQISCKLSDVVSNVGGIANNGGAGWDNWLQISTQTQNDPYGAYLLSINELNARMQGRQNTVTLDLELGKGFLSWESCDVEETLAEATIREYGTLDTDTPGKPQCKQKSTKTPGSVVESQLNHALGSDLRSLELADDIDEIVGALFNQMISQIMKGAQGLLGGNKSSASEDAARARAQIEYMQKLADEQRRLQEQADRENQNSRTNVGSNVNTNVNGETERTVVGENNLALQRPASQSTIFNYGAKYYTANFAVDGNTQGIVDAYSSLIAITGAEPSPWWQVNTGTTTKFKETRIWRRTNDNAYASLGKFRVSVLNAAGTQVWRSQIYQASDSDPIPFIVNIPASITGQIVRIQRENDSYQTNCRRVQTGTDPLTRQPVYTQQCDTRYYQLQLGEVEVISRPPVDTPATTTPTI